MTSPLHRFPPQYSVDKSARVFGDPCLQTMMLTALSFSLSPTYDSSLSGSVWSSYRKSCVDMVMKWLVPESSGRYVNRMTNEALHKGKAP